MFRSAIALALGALLLVSAPAAAANFGGQLLYGDDSDLGIGARAEFPTPELMESTRIEVDFNWYFPDDPPGTTDATFWEADVNWLYDLPLDTGDSPVGVYLGAGLNYAYSSVSFDDDQIGDQSDKDLGVNVLGGAKLPIGELTGIAEVRITIGGTEQYTLGIGLMY